MIDVIATILILYLLYKLVFDFIVPVSRTTTQFKNNVNDMRNRQQEQMRNQKQQNQGQNTASRTKPASNKTNTTTTDGEYIDFEEVK